MPATPSVGSLERALRDLRRDIDSLRADIFTNPRPMRATLDMGGNRIVNLGKPIDSLDAETKAGRAASGVSSFAKSGSAGITGAVTISGGSNVTLTQAGQNVEIASTASGTGDLLADGTVPLTANWDAGAFEIRALTFESDVATGTAPLVVASTTVVTNLNADLLDGNSAAAFGLVANPLSQFAATTSAQLAGVISDETGSGALVFGTSPTVASPTLTGTVTTGDIIPGLNNANDLGSGVKVWRSLYVSRLAELGTNGFVKTSGGNGALSVDTSTYMSSADIGVTVQAYDADLTTWAGITPAAGVGTFLATPSSANLLAAVTDETGTGALVFANTPTLVTPRLGTPTSGVLTNCTGLPLGGIATQADATILGNNTGGAASPVALTATQTKTLLSLGNVENTALSTWAGTGNIVTVGSITTGTWGGNDITVENGGTGRSTGTTAYALVATGTTATGAQQTLASGATTEVLVGGGASALPVWTTATGTGAPVRATSPTLVTPVIGAATGTSLDLVAGGGSISINALQSIWLGGSGTGVRTRQNASGAFTISTGGSDRVTVSSAGVTTTGALDATSIGATTPGSGAFTTLVAKQGSASDTVKVGGRVYVNTTAVLSTSTAYTDLMSYTLAASTLAATGDSLHVKMGFENYSAAVSGWRVTIDGDVVYEKTATGSAANDWFEMDVYRTSATVGEVYYIYGNGNVTPTVISGRAVVSPSNWSNAIVIEAQGKDSASSGDQAQYLMDITYLPANT